MGIIAQQMRNFSFARWKEFCGWMVVIVTQQWNYLMPLICTLKNVKMVKCVILPKLENNKNPYRLVCAGRTCRSQHFHRKWVIRVMRGTCTYFVHVFGGRGQ